MKGGDVSDVSDDTKACPVCAETIKAAAIKCRFCNTDLVEFEAAKEAEVERVLFAGNPAVITSLGQWLVVVLTLGIGWLVYWLKSRSVLYTLTTQRIQIERGLFSTVKASVELFRIDDFDIHRPFGMRMLGHSDAAPALVGSRPLDRRHRRHSRPRSPLRPAARVFAAGADPAEDHDLRQGVRPLWSALPTFCSPPVKIFIFTRRVVELAGARARAS